MNSFPKALQQRDNETKSQYLKRLNATAFRCAECNQVFLNTYMHTPGMAICKTCGELDMD